MAANADRHEQDQRDQRVEQHDVDEGDATAGRLEEQPIDDVS